MIARSSTPALWLALAVAAAPDLFARAETSLADALPAETFFYASVDAAAFERGIRNLDLANLLRDAEVAAFLHPLMASLAEEGIDPEDPIGSMLARAPTAAWLKGAASFGIAGFEFTLGNAGETTFRVSPEHPVSARLAHRMIDIENGDGTTGGTRFAVDALLSCEPGDELRTMVREFLAAPPSEFTVTTTRMAKKEITVVDIAFPDGKSTRVYADLAGEKWIFGGTAHSFEAAISGGRQDSLARSRSYQNFHRRLTAGENALFMMFDAKRVLAMFRSFVPPILLEEAEILGIDTLRGIGLGLSFAEGGVRESLLVGFDGAPRGVFAPLAAFSGGFATLDAAPANTAFFAGLKLDLKKLVDSLEAESAVLLPNDAKLVGNSLAEVQIGSFSLLNDLVPTFGDEISLALGPSNNPIVPDALFTLELRDPARFQKVLDYARSAGAEQGVELRPLPLADGREAFSLIVQGAPFQPAFVVDGNRLIGAISGYALRSAIARNQGKATDSLADDPGLASLRRAMAGCSPKAAALWLHLDLSKVLPSLYEMGAVALPGLIAEEGLPLDAAQLPLAETITPYLKSIALAIHCDEGGLSIDAFSPMGLLGLGLVAGILDAQQSHAMAEMEALSEMDEMGIEIEDDSMDDGDEGADDGGDGDGDGGGDNDGDN